MLISKSNYCPKCKGPHSNDCYAVYDNGSYCYSCGFYKFYGENYFAFKPEFKKDDSRFSNLEFVTNPRQFSQTVLDWLYKYYMYDDLITKYHIMYAPYDEVITKGGAIAKGESLIFPVVKGNNEITFFQRRFFPDKDIFSVGNLAHPTFIGDTGDTLVITEDLISSVRVHESSEFDSLCLFGTGIKKDWLGTLNFWDTRIIWLDGDEPGQQAAKIIESKLHSYAKYHNKEFAFDPINPRIINIKTDKDPKAYSPSEIKQILEEYTDDR